MCYSVASKYNRTGIEGKHLKQKKQKKAKMIKNVNVWNALELYQVQPVKFFYSHVNSATGGHWKQQWQHHLPVISDENQWFSRQKLCVQIHVVQLSQIKLHLFTKHLGLTDRSDSVSSLICLASTSISCPAAWTTCQLKSQKRSTSGKWQFFYHMDQYMVKNMFIFLHPNM